MATAKLQAQAGKLNIVIEQGATFNPVFTYRDDQAALINLTGYTARMQIKLKRTSPSTIEDMTTVNGKITLGGAAGTITLLLTDTETAAYTFTSAVYDLELIDASAVVTRLLQGSVVLSTEVTT